MEGEFADHLSETWGRSARFAAERGVVGSVLGASAWLSTQTASTSEDVWRQSALTHQSGSDTPGGPAYSVPAGYPTTRPLQGAPSRRSFSTSARRQAMHTTPYDLLGLPRSASREEIKSSYYELVKSLHPDKIGPNVSETERKARVEKFRSVAKAYDLLKDPKKRAMYDKYAAGWDMGPISAPAAQWQRHGQTRPRTDAEWAHWHAWSESLRTGQGHRQAWQRMAQNPHYAAHFYGFPHVSPEERRRQMEEAAPWNQLIFAALLTVGSIIAALQIQGIKTYSAIDSHAADQSTATAARNLEAARLAARSEEGMMRQRRMLERARELKQLRASSTTDVALSS